MKWTVAKFVVLYCGILAFFNATFYAFEIQRFLLATLSVVGGWIVWLLILVTLGYGLTDAFGNSIKQDIQRKRENQRHE